MVSKTKSKSTTVTRKIHGKGVATSSLKAVPYSSEKKTANMAFLFWSSERGDVTKHLEDAGISVTSYRLLKKEKWQEKFSAFKVVVGYNYVHKDSTFEAVLFSSSRHG